MKIYLTPKEVTYFPGAQLPRTIRIDKFSTEFIPAEPISVSVSEPLKTNIISRSFIYEKLDLVNSNYSYVYVLVDFKDWFLDTFELRPNYPERFPNETISTSDR